MSPAHSRNQGRGLIVLVVLAVLAGVAVLDRSPGVATPGGPPLAPTALVSASDAESSAWYCTGSSTTTGKTAPGALILTNTSAHAVTASITSTSDTGASVQASLPVPARDQLVPNISSPSSGTWASQSVVLSGGGVAVSQAVHGPSGWSEAPCASRTAQDWYFPSGNTSGTNQLYISVFNPTSSPDVVDLAFTTPGGLAHPINFQGMVVPPGQVQVANVAAFVQEQAAVATTVTSRTGRVVASELEAFASPTAGLALVSGVPFVSTQWSIPQSDEVSGASSEIDVFNPGSTSENVTVTVHLASGPVAPFTHTVLPLTTWALSTSNQTRIPKADAYSTEVAATGGSGVVVGRLVVAPASAPAPQAGVANAVDALTSSWPSWRWLVPTPGSTATPAVTGAIPEHLALANPSGTFVHYSVTVFAPGRTRTITSGSVRPHEGVSLSGATLFGAGLHSLLVKADGPLSVSEDVGPTGAYGVITMPGIAMDS
jgi:hypothetical protein